MTDFEPAYLTRPGAEAMLPVTPDVIEEVPASGAHPDCPTSS